MNTNVLCAVFKRNFVNYFANPTGYVFICVFVVLSALSAFWPNEFFNRNVANLDQLSWAFPLIMLVFIPAITMSVWADERRQGTDELLLTIPAGDFDVVLGKYLAATAILSVSLVFSLVCNYLVLNHLANADTGFTLLPHVDFGLFVGTYIGYWLIGLAMLAVGMVASFLTGNLTVAYILGVIFNVPLVFAMFGDVIFDPNTALTVKQWSLGEQFRDFGRGVLSFAGLAYFGMIVAVMLYLSMVLIGRRHWRAAQGTMSNAVFYPVLHLLWAASFVTFGLFLSQYYSGTNVLVGLAVAYVLLHAALLWGWSEFPREGSGGSLSYMVPVLQAVSVGVFALVAARLRLMEEPPEYLGKLLIGLFAAYVVVHLFLAIGWLRYPHQVSLVPGHYIVRFLALVLAAAGLNVLLHNHDLRWDVTQEKLSSLSPTTVELLGKLDPKRTVQVEAFISPEVPEWYVTTRLNLISKLQEIQARSGNKIQVRINNTEQYSEEADRAKRLYNITARRVSTPTRGTYKDESIFLGVAVKSGLDTVKIPFFDRGLSPEYELVRSLATVTQQKRKRVGVLTTEVPLFGRFDPSDPSGGGGEWPIVEELKKQYEVVQVDPSSPINEKYDVLLAVQPSSLAPEQMENFIAAVRSGQPTAIFEDPFPYFARGVTATSAPKRPPGGMNPMMMMQQQQNMPKGDITQLWNLLGIRFSGDKGEPGDQIIAQNYNPYPKLAQLSEMYPEFVFVDTGCNADAFNKDAPVTAKLQHVLFPFPGYVDKLNASQLESMEYKELVRTGTKTATERYNEVMSPMMMFGMGDLDPNRPRKLEGRPFTLAAQVRGKVRPVAQMADEKKPEEKEEQDAKKTEATKTEVPKADEQKADEPKTGEPKTGEPKTGEPKTGEKPAPEAKAAKPVPKKPESSEINVIVVADIDMLHQAFFDLRARGEIPESGVNFDFDNVTFVLNVLDTLAGETSFVDIRSRRPAHRTLAKIDQRTEEARKQTDASIKKAQDEFEKVRREEETALRDSIKKLKDEMEKEKLNPIEVLNRAGMVQEARQKQLDAKIEQLTAQKDEEVRKIRTEWNLEVRRVQNSYKLWALLLPPILPLLVGLVVFLNRRSHEREGVSRRRLRS